MNYYEVSFTLDPILPAREVLVAELAERGFESFVETENGLLAYISEHDYHEEVLDQLMTQSIDDLQFRFEIKLIQDENWNAEWEKNFSPIVVGDQLLIRAPFHEPMAEMKEEIIIEPKMSFGTGHHGTTYLISDAIMHRDMSGLDVLDMGCGTGVLAILAVKRGARNVDAIDIDDWAYENTIENCERNGTSSIQVMKGGAELLGSHSYDLILANINRNILTRDMKHYVSVLRPGGNIIFSGFYPVDAPEIEAVATSLGLTPLGMHTKDEWCMTEFTKPQ